MNPVHSPQSTNELASSPERDHLASGIPVQRVNLAGVIVDLLERDVALRTITDRASQPPVGDIDAEVTLPLSVISANLDHIAQFGTGGRWHGTIGDSLRPVQQPVLPDDDETTNGSIMEWMTLLDGSPLVSQSNRLTGKSWPRLAGSDLIGELLDAAEESGISVGFLGGSYIVQRLLSRRLAKTRPRLSVAGMWAPERSVLVSHQESLKLAESIRSSGAQLLVVGLGKPRQELWMARYGAATGANVLLAFGAVVDFLAGTVRRAPIWSSKHGLEWAWRLALEPRRLARRYLVDDPPSLLQMRRNSSLLPQDTKRHEPTPDFLPVARTKRLDDSFVNQEEPADVVVYIVTYNSVGSLDGLMASLRREATSLRIRVVVADNDSADDTLKTLGVFADAHTLSTGGNLGYSRGINTAHSVGGNTDAILVLNPDVEIVPGAIAALYQRMVASQAGVVVPRLLNLDGSIYTSLRREPTIATAFGDALFGARFTTRPGWLAESDYAPDSYQNAHRIDWATGAAIMIRADLAERLGDWDEQFFLYSEEVDYFRRAREVGETAWYEPAARMIHSGGGSGSSVELDALLAVNRVRYVRKYHDARYTSWFRRGVALTEVLRFYKTGRMRIYRTIMDEATWEALPGPTAAESADQIVDGFPSGAVIIPAHNEAAVIGRTLAHLAPALETGKIDVIVVCNACDDETANIARSFKSIKVIEIVEASKVAALNAADSATTAWPRIYLDADIEISPTALRMVLERLHRGDVLAVRPSFRYVCSDASWPIRAFYRARRRLPSTSEHLWGAGVYGVSRQGHERFGRFPSLTADDLFIDQQFAPNEKAILTTPPVQVRTPRDAVTLMRVLRRNYRGKRELAQTTAHHSSNDANGLSHSSSRETLRQLFSSIRGLPSTIDAATYATLVLSARLPQAWRPNRTSDIAWERDESSRL